MKDQIQTPTNMKAGIFANSKKEEPKSKIEVIEDKKVDDTVDTVSLFMDSIVRAKANNIASIEVSDDVFEHYMRGQKTPYFYYQNIRVYRKGTGERIEYLEGLIPEERQRQEGKV